jgi:DNA-binding NarL/FixJ family response regulator
MTRTLLQTRPTGRPTSHAYEPLPASPPSGLARFGSQSDLAVGLQNASPVWTVTLADDHPLVLRGLQELIGAQPEFLIRSASADGETALADIRRERPDLAVLDLNMPRLSGLEIVRALVTERISARVVFVTAALTDDQILEAVTLGVWGIVLKDMAAETIVDCLKRVTRGDRWLPGDLIQAAISGQAGRRARRFNSVDTLTTREREVADLVARCLSNKEIATQLNLSEGTIKIHLHNIYRKLAINSRTALTVFALGGRVGADQHSKHTA